MSDIIKQAAIIRAAEAATEATEAKIRIAYDELRAARYVNGYGVYNDRNAIGIRILAAKCALDEAARALETLPRWPSHADYEPPETD